MKARISAVRLKVVGTFVNRHGDGYFSQLHISPGCPLYPSSVVLDLDVRFTEDSETLFAGLVSDMHTNHACPRQLSNRNPPLPFLP